MSALGTLGWMTPIAIAAAGACALIFRYLVALLGLVVTLHGANVEDRASIFDAFVAAIRPSTPSEPDPAERNPRSNKHVN
jgi:hypothetical protein